MTKGAPGGEPETAREITLQGADGIRALAHPARAVAIERLIEGPPATATQLAKEVGITASAMSYHLRELAKRGIVRRVESAEDGRERLWEAAGTSLSVVPDVGHHLPNLAVQAVVGRYLDKLFAAIDRFGREHTREGTIKYSTLWLTELERGVVNDALEAALRAVEVDRRSATNHPADAGRYEMWTFLLPDARIEQPEHPRRT